MVLGVHLCDPSLPTPPVCKAADAYKQPSLCTQLSTSLTISTRPREDDRQKPLHISCTMCSSNSPKASIASSRDDITPIVSSLQPPLHNSAALTRQKRKLRHRSYGFAPGPTHMLLSSHASAPVCYCPTTSPLLCTPLQGCGEPNLKFRSRE